MVDVLFSVWFDLLPVLEPLDLRVRVVRLHLHDDLVLLEVLHRLQLLLEADRTVWNTNALVSWAE